MSRKTVMSDNKLTTVWSFSRKLNLRIDRKIRKITNLPDTDEVVTVSGKEGLAISTPGKGQALGWISPGSSRHLRESV